MKILILLLDHGPFETIINKLLPEIAYNTKNDNLLIYWERLTRVDNTENKLMLGLEDPLLTALFYLVVCNVSLQDDRVYDIMERGVGLKKNNIPTTVPRLALIAARGAESLISLNKIINLFPIQIRDIIISINIKELIERRHDLTYVGEVTYKLQQLLAMLLNWIEIHPKYNRLLNVNDLILTFNNIKRDNPIKTNEEYALHIKTIISHARDISNYEFVKIDTLNRIKEQALVILAAGGAHYYKLNELFTSANIPVSPVYLYKDSAIPTDIQVELFLEESITNFIKRDGVHEYSLRVG